MSQIGSSIPLADQEPKGWRKLCEKAQRERNPQKLDAILKQVNQLLTEHEKRCSVAVEAPKSL